MANALGLNVLFSANASGMSRGLSQVDRQLKDLGRQVTQASSVFSSLASTSGAAAAAQLKFATDTSSLAQAHKDGVISAEQYVTELQAIVGAARESAAAFAEGARITEQVATAEERRTAQLERLGQLLEQGAISEETYSRAAAEASGANAEAAAAETERARALARAAQITAANLSPQERYDQAVEELNGHLNAGRITQETYNSALNKAAQDFAKATIAADRFDDAAENAGGAGTLQFNELSGVLAAIPGPIGNVAGRLSGLASAGEGLGRVFSGGISQGLSNVGASVAGLVNPFTAGLAAVAAFGAGATAVARGLIDLEDRVEKLGNQAFQLGVSFDFVQVIEESAIRSGTSVDSLRSATTRLQQQLVEASNGSQNASQAIAALGLSVEELSAANPDEQFRLIASAITSIEDPAARTAAATRLFGEAGVQLLPFFRNLGGAADDIERYGAAISDLDRGRLVAFGEGVDALGVATRGLGQELTLPFVGLGEGIAQGAAEFLGGVNSIVGPIGDVLEPALSNLGRLFEIFGTNVGTIGRVIGTVLEPVGRIFQGLGQSLEPFYDGIVGINQSIADATVATAEWLVSFTTLGVIADNIGAIGETVSRVANIIGTAFTQVAQYIGEVVASWTEFFGLQSAIESIGNVISSIFGGVSSTFQTIANAIGGTVGRLLTIAENFLGIKNEVETPIVAELDLSQPALAATQFADEIGKATTAASEFGEAGFQAALRYQEALEQVAQLQADGTFSAEEAKRAAEQAGQSFETTIAGLEREAEAQRNAAEEAQRAADEKIAAAERAAAAAIQADQRRADSFIATQGLGGEDPATKAAEDLLAITRQIEEAEAAIVAARAAGDAAAEQAATRRLAILDQAEAAAQETIEFGFSSQDAARAIEEVRGSLDDTFTFDNFELAPEAFAAAQEQLRQLELDLEAKVIDPDTFEEAADAIRRGFDDALRTAERIRDLNEQYAERAAEIDAERIDALSQVSQQPLQIEDVRTGAGISEFLRLATGREDPAIAEYRKQLSELQKIAREIRELGGVVEIVGAN